MKVTVLIDNNARDGLKSEWGLSFHIEFKGKNYLLDTGASDAFIHNAVALGINIADVDAAVISHAHYDHSLGMEAFFKQNSKAVFHISANAGENCYGGWHFLSRYIGLPKGILSGYESRIVRHNGITAIDDGVFLVPHSTPGLERLGRQNHLYVRRGLKYTPDDFSHEQTLVFRTERGLAVFNSCSHSGPEVVAAEVMKAFPGESIHTYLGGLHLFRFDDRQVIEVARKIRQSGIDRIYTGHCTGDRAFELLRRELGECISPIYSGMQMEL